jgi:hypothetical protein
MKQVNHSKSRFAKYDKLWSRMVKERDEQCQVIGCNERNLAAHHIEGRRKNSTRLFLDNGITLCLNHHTENHKFSAHKTPKKFKLWFSEAFPDRWESIKSQERILMNEQSAIQQFLDEHFSLS